MNTKYQCCHKPEGCVGFAPYAAPAPVDPRLLNMLAVLHRDGGHYVAEHGLDKAIADAKEKYLAAVQSHDAQEPGKGEG